ncbi:hypothetical protein [Aurantivibrio infirmus]
MSSIFLIILLAVFALALVIYSAVSQYLESKRQQQQHHSKILKIRYSNLAKMLTGFPQKFLTKELIIFSYHCLIETCRQLSLVETKGGSYALESRQLEKQLLEFENKSLTRTKVPLTNLKIIQQARFHLQELHKIIEKRREKKLLSTAQARIYFEQIQTLMLQLSTDAYVISAIDSENENNPKLSAHYYALALKLLEGKKLDDYLLERQQNFRNKLKSIETNFDV